MMKKTVKKFKLKKNEFKLRNFPFKDYQIVQISDLHLGFGTLSGTVKQLVHQVLDVSPDLVVITGDLLEGDIYTLKQEIKIFKELTNQIDTYFILGNHDCQYNLVSKVLELLQSLNIKVLINESIWIGDSKQGFNLAGVTDYVAIRYGYNYPKEFRPNIENSLKDIKQDFPTILLSHRPIKRYTEKKYNVDLTISGHIHGGQIYPFGYFILLIKEDSGEKLYIRTKKIDKNRYIHVSKGLGVTRLPFRVFVAKELNLITINPI
jgi:predicted MPP superfamily phosphohydrolase